MARKVKDSILDEVFIASPCSVPWDSMTGDERKRACSGCSRNVYNISDMSRKEAEDFIRQNGESHCITFYRRFDGTILTDDCPVGLRKIRDRAKQAIRFVASIAALVLSLPQAIGQSVDSKSTEPLKEKIQLRGKPAAPTNFQPMPPGGITAPPPNFNPKSNTTSDTSKTTDTKSNTTSDKNPKSTKTHPDGSKSGDKKNSTTTKVTDKQRELLDTRAREFFDKARKSISEGRTDLGEFYLEKAIEAYDSQKSGDPQFRKKLASELSRIQLLNKKNGK